MQCPYFVSGGYSWTGPTLAAQQQIAVMGTQVFEVGLFKPSAAEEGRAVMIPRIWDSATLIRSIPWLRMQNADGRNIYVRPKGEHDLSLVDDLSADAVKRRKATGFTPAAVVETSPGNFQAWLKHPHQLPRELSTMAARKLAEEFGGDRGAADWRHFGRLAGFTNRKPKYMTASGLFPFVRLIEAPGIAYPEGERFAGAISAQREVDVRIRERHRSTPRLPTPQEVEKHRRLPFRSTLCWRCYSRRLGISDLCPLTRIEW
jgi:RepB DNA-primase from phage plasmid